MDGACGPPAVMSNQGVLIGDESPIDASLAASCRRAAMVIVSTSPQRWRGAVPLSLERVEDTVEAHQGWKRRQ
jgi:hypothetical protein